MRKTAIITGANRGIGLATAKLLLEHNYCTVLCARKSSEEIHRLAEIYPNELCFISADIAKPEDRTRILTETIQKFGRLDILVNNAGVAPRNRKDMLEIDEQDFDYVMDINLKGTYFLSQEAAKLIQQQEKGYIINTGSISADTVSLNRAEYCISKAGIRMLTQLFAARLAEYHIGVFEISPGVIDTDMISPVRDKYMELALNGTIPARRLGLPEDMAKIVLSIANGYLDYSTGTVIHCGGGLHISSL